MCKKGKKSAAYKCAFDFSYKRSALLAGFIFSHFILLNFVEFLQQLLLFTGKVGWNINLYFHVMIAALRIVVQMRHAGILQQVQGITCIASAVAAASCERVVKICRAGDLACREPSA